MPSGAPSWRATPLARSGGPTRSGVRRPQSAARHCAPSRGSWRRRARQATSKPWRPACPSWRRSSAGCAKRWPASATRCDANLRDRDEPVRILIADDDLTSRLVLTGVLKKSGHDVVTVVDGDEAWEAMRQPDAPALAILDWMMPGLAGVEVCRLIRGRQSDQPPYLILLTSRGEKADIVAGLEAGADDYLAKPFDPGELRARVEVGRRMIDLQARLLETRDALSHEATHDPLTGALNRRAFGDALSRAISEERRHHRGLALGICDVDRFKAVNDTHGHQVGDAVSYTHLRAHE